MAQQKGTMRFWVQSLASISGLRSGFAVSCVGGIAVNASGYTSD